MGASFAFVMYRGLNMALAGIESKITVDEVSCPVPSQEQACQRCLS